MKTISMKLVGCVVMFAVGATAVAGEIETGSVLGIKRVKGLTAERDAAVAVPWLNAAKENCTVAELITTGLATSDTIKVYDLTARAYYIWVVDTDGRTWTKAGNAPSSQPEATAYTLARGRAFWYVKAGGNKVTSYTQVGQHTDTAITTQVDKEETSAFFSPTHSLLVNPKWAAFKLAEKLTAAAGCANDDVVVNASTGARYRFNGTAWEKEVETVVQKGSVTVTQKTWTATDADESIPAGIAFWYLSAGGQPTIQW